MLGLIRHNDSVFWKFVDLGGDKLIVNAVQSTCQQMKIKAAFLILATSQMDNSIAGQCYILPFVMYINIITNYSF